MRAESLPRAFPGRPVGVVDPSSHSHRDANLERLELAAEASGIGFWEWDLIADRLVPDRFLSARFGMGLRADCPPSEEFEQLVHPEDIASFNDAIKRALVWHERTRHRARMVQLDGGVRHVDVYLQVSRDKLGKPMRMLGMLKDVTAEIEAAQQLASRMSNERQLLERLSVAIQAAGLTCWEYAYRNGAEDGSFTWVDSLPDGTDAGHMSIEEVNRVMAASAIPEDVEALRVERAKALASGAQTLSSRVRRRTQDGRIRYFQIYQKFFRDEHGRPVRALGARRDVTEEVHASELLRLQKDELQAAQRRLERASLSVQEGHWEVDLVTMRHWASSNYHALLGYTSADWHLGTLGDVSALLHPDDTKRAHDAWTAHLYANVPHDVEVRLRSRDGSYRWFRVRGKAERDEAGIALRISGSITEIERQKAAEDALREAQAQFERAIHGTKDGLWEVDVVAGKMWLSPRLHEILGYEVGELGDHHTALRDLVHPDDLPISDAAVARQAQSAEPIEFEVRMRRKNGDYRWYSFRGSPSTLTLPVTRVSGSMQDVTKERLAQDALVRASEEAQSANQAKSAFLANMSHEIRTPMNGIMGMATLLLDTRLDPGQREFAEVIQTSSQSLLTVINDILDFSKIEAGKLEIESIELDAREVMEDVASTLEFQARAKGLRLIVEVEPDVPPRVIGDPQRIRQCLLNLIGNAIKFTREGGVAATVSAAGTRDGKALIRFEVRDTGIGISPQCVKTLFQPFVQADSSTTRHFGGTGLGLSIVRGLVEMMGGEVGAQSEPGTGSTFWFVLPMDAISAGVPRAAREEAEVRWNARRFRGRVLLVEDNAVNQKVAQRFLERLGCEVVLADNGEQGVSAWESGDYALVLMDIQMPVMDGYTATRRIRERECASGVHTPIFALTANAMKGQLDRCIEAGMDGLLTKPIVAERLREMLERLGLGVEDEEVLSEVAVESMVTAPAPPAAVDTSQLVELAGEDHEFVQSVVASFEKSMAQLLATLHAAAERGEMQQVARAAHQVKGAAANLHANPLSALAAEIEASARSLPAAEIQEKLKLLAVEITRATTALHAFAERLRSPQSNLGS